MVQITLKLLRYCLVGFFGMIIDFGTTWLLKENFKINKYVSNSAGFLLAATSNFFFNKIWTFHSVEHWNTNEYLLFFLFALIGLVLNNLVIYVLTGSFKLNFYISKGLAIVLVTFWNFIMNYIFTFSATS